jgi:hypothetical protein
MNSSNSTLGKMNHSYIDNPAEGRTTNRRSAIKRATNWIVRQDARTENRQRGSCENVRRWRQNDCLWTAIKTALRDEARAGQTSQG